MGIGFVMRIARLQLTPILTLHLVIYGWKKLLRPQVPRVAALRIHDKRARGFAPPWPDWE
jgi:hypothetical protein